LTLDLMPYRRYVAKRRTAGFGKGWQQWSGDMANWAPVAADFECPRLHGV